MSTKVLSPRQRARRMVLAAGLRPVLPWVDWCEARLMAGDMPPSVLQRAAVTLAALVAQGNDAEAVLWQSLSRGADWPYPMEGQRDA